MPEFEKGCVSKMKGYYGYQKDKSYTVHYVVEFTREQKIIDIMDTSKFDFDMLDKKEFDYLEDAMNFYNTLYYDETVLHLMMFEEFKVNGKTVLEQCKEYGFPTPYTEILHQKDKEVRQAREVLSMVNAENEMLKAYLKKFKIDVAKVKQEMESEVS